MPSEPAHRLDTTGLRCPLPVLKARKRIKALAPGEAILVVADDPVAAIDVPHFCAEDGHRLIERWADGDVLNFIIVKGG